MRTSSPSLIIKHYTRLKFIAILSSLFCLAGAIYFLWTASHLPRPDFFLIFSTLKESLFVLGRADFSYWQVAFSYFLQTIILAFTSTLAGYYLSIPLAILQSINFTPHPCLLKIFRPFFAALRAIPSLIWAAILVQIFSIGNLAGLIALTILTTLMSTHLVRESLDAISPAHLYLYAFSGKNAFLSFFLYILPILKDNHRFLRLNIFETALRSSAVLGLVGAGGLGVLMQQNLSYLRYDRLASLILLLFISIACLEFLLYFFKKRQIKQALNLTSFSAKNLVIPIFLLLIYAAYFGQNSLPFKVGLKRLGRLFNNLWRIDWIYLIKILPQFFETIFLAMIATLLAAFLAYLLSPFFTILSLNTMLNKSKVGNFVATKHRKANDFLSYSLILVLKFLPNLMRIFPPLILAILFLKNLGPGAFSGLLALTIYTLGIILKWFTEWLENNERNWQLSAICSERGLGFLKRYFFFLWQQNKASFFAFSLYRLEGNIRNASILGMVGAGGIGYLLNSHIAWQNWSKVGSIMFLIFATNIIFDLFAYYYRKYYNELR